MGLRGALIADTMPPASLTAAMGIARTTSDTARIFGALTGAGLFAAIGIGPSLCRDHGVLSAGRGADLERASAPRSALAEEIAAEEAAAKPSPWRELWEGMRARLEHAAAAGHRLVRFLFNFAVFPLTNGLMPYAARDIFGTDQTGLGYLIASVGGRRVHRLHHHDALRHADRARPHHDRRRGDLARPGADLRADDTLWAGIVMLMLCGFAQSLTMVCHTVILLSASSPRYRGRIMGVRMLAIYSLPLGLLAAGVLIELDRLPRQTVSLYTVVGLTFTVLIAVYWRDSLWRLRNLDAG